MGNSLLKNPIKNQIIIYSKECKIMSKREKQLTETLKHVFSEIKNEYLVTGRKIITCKTMTEIRKAINPKVCIAA